MKSHSSLPSGPGNKSLTDTVRRLAHVAHAQGHSDALTLGTKVHDLLLRPKEPLTEEELNRIMDVLTSPLGHNVIARVNQYIFIRFLREMASREQSLAELTTTELDKFQKGGIGRHQQLRELGALLRAFADEEKSQKPEHITAEGIWAQVQNQQYLATIIHNRQLFTEACINGSASVLHSWEESHGQVDLCYDPQNNLLGAWERQKGKDGNILGREVLSGHKPTDIDIFYGAHNWILPCTDQSSKLCLVEFDPRGMGLFSHEPWYISVIPSDSITDRGVIKALNGEDEIFYCVHKNGGDYHVTHSGPGNSIRSDLPLKKLEINGDVLFVAQHGTTSLEQITIRSLRTGGLTEILLHLIEKIEEREDDIIIHLKKSMVLDDEIDVEGSDYQKWKLGNFLQKKKTISLVELQKLWEKTVRTAKLRKK